MVLGVRVGIFSDGKDDNDILVSQVSINGLEMFTSGYYAMKMKENAKALAVRLFHFE